MRTEYYIKTGLVILGAEILFSRIVEFGPYGLAIAWGVTPGQTHLIFLTNNQEDQFKWKLCACL